MRLRFTSYWHDRFPTSRRPSFPRQRGQIDTDVIVVGGGLTGCACAFACAAARVSVVLIAADRVGAEASGGVAGLSHEDFDAAFGDTVARHGLRAARTLWQGMRRAALELPASLRRQDIRADLSSQDVLWIAPPERAATKALRREYDERRAAGIEHRWIRASNIARDAALDAGGAIRTRASSLDPYRACLGLARAATARGAALFESSAPLRVRPKAKGIEVTTPGGIVRGERVVITSDASVPDLRPLRRHLHRRHAYAVVTEPLPAGIQRELGSRTLALRDMHTPPHLVRWLREDRVLVEGGDQDPVPSRSQRQTLVQRTGQLMYELSLLYPAVSGIRPEWSWSFGFDDTVDGLPYIGPHRNFPRHLFALGLARHGSGAAWLAARVLFRHLSGELTKGDEAFGFQRIL